MTVKAELALVQPFFTTKFPVYVPAAVLAGMLMVKGLLPGMAASVTAVKLFEGDPFQVMLYVVGDPAVAL